MGTQVYLYYFSIFDFDVVINGASADVVNVANENDWVTRVDVRLPASLTATPGTLPPFNVTLRESGLPAGPLSNAGNIALPPRGGLTAAQYLG